MFENLNGSTEFGVFGKSNQEKKGERGLEYTMPMPDQVQSHPTALDPTPLHCTHTVCPSHVAASRLVHKHVHGDER
jgi:hypothetical protein